jgi:hypothetical protein
VDRRWLSKTAAVTRLIVAPKTRLNHPHIVTVHDFGDVDGLYSFTWSM